MAYWSRLHIIGVKIKKIHRSKVKKLIKNHKSIKEETFLYFLDKVVLDSQGWLSFKHLRADRDAYAPDELGTVCAKDAKWFGAESIATWLKTYSENGGSLVEHSLEGDGEACGWEFDGKGTMRRLSLKPAGKWR